MGLAAEEPRRARLGLLEDLLDAQAGRVDGAEVGARLAQRAGDRVADLVGDLRAAGGVEEGEARSAARRTVRGRRRRRARSGLRPSRLLWSVVAPLTKSQSCAALRARPPSDLITPGTSTPRLGQLFTDTEHRDDESGGALEHSRDPQRAGQLAGNRTRRRRPDRAGQRRVRGAVHAQGAGRGRRAGDQPRGADRRRRRRAASRCRSRTCSSEAGHPPADLRTTAACGSSSSRPASAITRIELSTVGDVPGVDEADVRAARRAGEGDVPGVARAGRDRDHARRRSCHPACTKTALTGRS